MPTSPEAASNAGGVVERLRTVADEMEPLHVAFISRKDLRALLAVVEAANGVLNYEHHPTRLSLSKLRTAVDALYTPDSAEERNG